METHGNLCDEKTRDTKFTKLDALKLLREGDPQNVKIPEGYTVIECDAFESCKSLESVMIPSSVKSIDKFAFFGCQSLKAVFFANGSQLETIGARAFYGCEQLESINVPYQVKCIGDRAFAECRNLIPSPIVVSTSTKVGYHSDWNCPRIKRRSKPNPTLAEKIASAEAKSLDCNQSNYKTPSDLRR